MKEELKKLKNQSLNTKLNQKILIAQLKIKNQMKRRKKSKIKLINSKKKNQKMTKILMIISKKTKTMIKKKNLVTRDSWELSRKKKKKLSNLLNSMLKQVEKICSEN